MVLHKAMEFNSDGSLRVHGEGKAKDDETLELYQEESPEQSLLLLIDELPFPVGKKLLSEAIRGEDNSRIRKLRLNLCEHYGALDLFDGKDVYDLIDNLLFDDLLEITKTRSSKYYPVLRVTSKGREFLSSPTSMSRASDEKGEEQSAFTYDEVTDKDRTIFSNLGNFLEGFNERQSKAVICDSENILCIAGAGSGKTTVLSKRIRFLTQMKGVNPQSILAITFTRKARQEMKDRLQGIPIHIETFNSFCEKFLRRNENAYLGSDKRVMGFREKTRVVIQALQRLGYTPAMAVDKYHQSKKGKDEKTLFFSMISDVFSVIDHYKNNMKDISVFKDTIVNRAMNKDKTVALFVYNLIMAIEDLKREQSLRDYTDQIVDSLKIMGDNPDSVPKYDHILVDEYQDVNDIQVRLLDILSPHNLFVVGDPRQSIFGWRGSKVKNIMKFPERSEECSVVQLTKNYRSSHSIVDAANKLISSMKMSDLESHSSSDAMLTLVKQKDEDSEAMFICQSILSKHDVSRDEIFVLARTNKLVDTIAEKLAQFGIDHITKKSDEKSESFDPVEGKVTVSTVHAIKGLEAEVVYVAGVNSKMFPCLVSEHPIQDLARVDFDYDKQEEELRLLYVAMTRAKSELHMSYTGKLSKFMQDDGVKKMFRVVDNARPHTSPKQDSVGTSSGMSSVESRVLEELKEWRKGVAKEMNILPFMVLPDRTFLQLAKRMPSKVSELHDIPGLGPTKIMNYGEELLDILNGM